MRKSGEQIRKAFCRCAAVVALSAFLPLYGGQEADVVKPGQKLTLDQCLAIALERLPAVLAARASVDAGRSFVRQAESSYFPQINWSSSLGRAHVGPRKSLGVPTAAVTYNSYSAGLNLSQTIFDFGRTAAQVRIQKLGYESSVSDLEAATQQAILGVRQADYGVLQAGHNRDVMAEARASLKIDRANEEALRLSVFLAVQQAYLNLSQSEELVPVAELNVTAAQENFDIASASYKEGVGDPIFSAVVGIFLGYYPAYKASRLDPILALRYE